jgi:hypothetical protein
VQPAEGRRRSEEKLGPQGWSNGDGPGTFVKWDQSRVVGLRWLIGSTVARGQSCLDLCAELIMKASRPPVAAMDSVEAKVVRLQRGNRNEETSRPEGIEELAALMQRASNAARQMKYFSLASKQFSFEELVSSARRAGFIQAGVNPQSMEALFKWSSGQPDLIFLVSFRDPARVSVVAQSRADVFGLVLTAYSHVAGVSVEINPTIGDGDLGHNALLFKDMLLTLPGFDDMPAWLKYPEGQIPESGGVVEMWRDGISLASVFGRAWNSISPRLLRFWELLRERWLS